MHDIKQILIGLIWQTPGQPVATKFVHLNDDDFISLSATLPVLGQTARNCDVWIGRLDKKSIWNSMKKYRYEILLSSTSNFGAISDIKAIILHTSIKILHNLHAKVCFIFYLRVCVYIYIYIYIYTVSEVLSAPIHPYKFRTFHYSDVTWASPSALFVKPFVEANIKENIQAPHSWHPVMETIDDWRIHPTMASEAELWCFLWSAPEQTVEWTIESPFIWDSIDLTMASP